MTLDRRALAGLTLAAAALGARTASASAPTLLAGRRLVYEVAGYRIRMEFVDETRLRWTYLAAPSTEETRKTALETVDRVDLRPGLVLMAWTEASGAHVVDVFDFDNQRLVANFVMPDGKRYQSRAEFAREA